MKPLLFDELIIFNTTLWNKIKRRVKTIPQSNAIFIFGDVCSGKTLTLLSLAINSLKEERRVVILDAIGSESNRSISSLLHQGMYEPYNTYFMTRDSNNYVTSRKNDFLWSRLTLFDVSAITEEMSFSTNMTMFLKIQKELEKKVENIMSSLISANFINEKLCFILDEVCLSLDFFRTSLLNRFRISQSNFLFTSNIASDLIKYETYYDFLFSL